MQFTYLYTHLLVISHFKILKVWSLRKYFTFLLFLVFPKFLGPNRNFRLKIDFDVLDSFIVLSHEHWDSTL
jgi:hypothetical protein